MTDNNTNITPPNYYGSSAYKVAGSGAWNSQFALGSASASYGSSVGGDGFAGKMIITVTGSTFLINNFQMDAILGTANATFVQYGNVIGGGTIDQSTGAMTLIPTGRLGAFSAPQLYDRPWNINDATTPCTTSGCTSNGNTAYASFTTGETTNSLGTIHGAALTAAGNGKFNAILVSGSEMGAAWDSLAGTPYFETWNISLETVPVPAAAWLFGSGLLGLGAVARRKKTA